MKKYISKFKILSMALLLIFTVSNVAFASGNDITASTISTDTSLINIETIKDNPSIIVNIATYSDGTIEYITVDKKTLLVTTKNRKGIVIDVVDGKTIVSTSEIKSIQSPINNTFASLSSETGWWILKKSFPRTNLKAAGNRASAVVSLLATVISIPVVTAYNVLNDMYTVITGEESMPYSFSNYYNNWEYATDTFFDAHNSSNGKLQYIYWFNGVYHDYKTSYFTWLDSSEY